MLFTRRNFLKGLGATIVGSLGFGGYAFGIKPFRLRIQSYKIKPVGWPRDLKLRIAALADIHACQPWMSPDRIRYIADQTNAQNPDIVVLLGDYGAGHRWVSDWVHSSDWSKALANLSAPLGVHAVLGNHDWWEDKSAQKRGRGPVFGQLAMERVGINVLENDAVRLSKDGHAVWLAGLGDQLALLPGRRWGRRRFQGVDDLPGTLAKVTDDAPVILLAHEPDIFPQVPERVSLTLCGHTHGGQVRLFGYSPVVPSRFRNRYAYGHIVETGKDATSRPRQMIVSGGLGCAIMPVRLGVPPEIVVIDIG